MKRLGPDLRMPDLKPPDFLADLFYDLHDRRLLAPIALVVVAIAAVPILLGGSSEEPSPAQGLAAPGELETGRTASLTVVEAKPGLRDYRKRLAAGQPTDPFKQHYASPELEGSELNSQTESSTSSTTTVTTGGSSEATTVSSDTTTVNSPPSYTPTPNTPSPSGGGGGDGTPHLTFYTWTIDVWISKSGGEDADSDDSQEPSVKRGVLPQTSIPGPKAPVVTYMGLSRKAAQKHHAKKALLLVSDEVTSVSSKARCVSGEEVCQLLEVEPGLPITFVYGANETGYTIKLLKAELVVTGHS